MSHDDDDGSPVRKGKLSAFQLLKSWLFDKKSDAPAHNETEFLNTRDGYELARFAQKAFGGDAEAKKAHEAAVEAEQAEIDALLQGTGAVPIPSALAAGAPAPAVAARAPAPAAPVMPSAPVASPPAALPTPAAGFRPMPPVPGAHGTHHPAPPPVEPVAPVVAPVVARAPARAAAAPAGGKPLSPLDVAVNHLEALRAQGMTVEVLAEALIVIESRDVKRRSAKAE